MHMSVMLFLAFVWHPCVAICQNLVPNGDFENFSLCPGAISQIQRAQPWFNARTGLPNGPGATPDYFNVCATSSIVGVPTNSQGNQVAQSGDAYAGLVAYLGGTADFREYAEVQLTETLVANKCYELRFFMSLGDSPTNSTVDGIGAYFSQNIAVQATNSAMSVVPQLDELGAFLTDSLGWQLVVATYEASGGERYLTLGNFNDDASTVVQQFHPSIYLPNCYFYLDDVSLIEVASGCGPLGVDEAEENMFTVFPSPTVDMLNVRTEDLGNSSLTLLDGIGRVVLTSSFQGSATVDVSQFLAGTYTCEVTSDGGSKVQRTRVVVSVAP